MCEIHGGRNVWCTARHSNGAMDKMLMLGLNEIIDQSAIDNITVC